MQQEITELNSIRLVDQAVPVAVAQPNRARR
jgi:hypothetical protein